jgi:hypothetical protein
VQDIKVRPARPDAATREETSFGESTHRRLTRASLGPQIKHEQSDMALRAGKAAKKEEQRRRLAKRAARPEQKPASSLQSDGAAEASTAVGARQQLPARLPDETLNETGPDEPQLQAGSESSQQQETRGHAAQHRKSVVWKLDDLDAALAQDAQGPASSLKSDGAAETSTAAGGR